MAGGWTLYDTHRQKLITGSATIPGNPISSNSTRPERGIQISILHAILLSAQTHNIKSGKVTIYIDNIMSFTKTTKPPINKGPLTHLTNDYNLKTIIHEFESNLWGKHQIEIIYTHVKGHQDLSLKINNLSIPAELNILCDKLATEAREQMTIPSILDTTIPQTEATLFIKNIQITEKLKDNIRHSLYNTQIQQYLQKNIIGQQQLSTA